MSCLFQLFFCCFGFFWEVGLDGCLFVVGWCGVVLFALFFFKNVGVVLANCFCSGSFLYVGDL